MLDCENLKKEGVTPWHGDVFDHPCYKYICKLSGKEVLTYFRCNESCKEYKPMQEHKEKKMRVYVDIL